MSGKEQGILRLGFILAAFAAAACVMLAFVYKGTEATIARNQKDELAAAQKELFPGADDFPEITEKLQSPDSSVAIEKQYRILRGGETIGVALQVSRGSYGGPVRILVGVGADNTIKGVKILEHKDTPGLGAKAASPSYTGQFAGKGVEDPFEVKGDKADVEAITASTITSRAVAGAVKAAGQAAAAYMGGLR